jgi:hypothetical protein
MATDPLVQFQGIRIELGERLRALPPGNHTELPLRTFNQLALILH